MTGEALHQNERHDSWKINASFLLQGVRSPQALCLKAATIFRGSSQGNINAVTSWELLSEAYIWLEL